MSNNLLSSTFRSIKPHKTNSNSDTSPSKKSPPTSQKTTLSSKSKSKAWSVYLIISTNQPIKTYVGVTTDFSRRLKEHNGELKGGSKASRAGRPWACACLIQGFKDHSEACQFESKWKICSRKLHRKKKIEEAVNKIDKNSLLLLQHRQAALTRVKDSFDCSNLDIDWQLSPF